MLQMLSVVVVADEIDETAVWGKTGWKSVN